MSQLTLDPFAAKVYWRREGDSPDGIWPELIRTFVENIARKVQSHKAVIGHIKGFACCGEHALRVNCVSAALPADVEGNLPPGTPEIMLDMVVLAYGLAWDDTRSAVDTAIEEAGRACNCHGRLQASKHGHSHTHDHK
jgi:hypothetical protein